MKFLVLGAGAIGGYYGGRLAEANADVTFLARPRRAQQIAERGLIVKSPIGDIACPAKTVLNADGAYDIVILTCKSYDLGGALDAIAPAMGAASAVLPLLNGMKHLEILSDRFGAHRVMGGCCSLSTTMLPSGDIQQMGPFENLFFGELDGARSSRLAALAEAFAKVKSNWTASTAIVQAMWDKWVTLAGAGAALTLVRGSIGDLLEAPTGADLLRAIVGEIGAVAAAYGYPPSPEVQAMMAGVLQWRGSPFTTSMTRDLLAGNRTEADHVIGDLVKRGEAKGVALPYLRAALANLQVHEARLKK